MTRSTDDPTERVSRRTVLQRGVLASGALALGGVGASGVVGAEDDEGAKDEDEESKATNEMALPAHLLVREDGAGEPSPVPDDDDPLVERRGGNPVDDGTDPTTVDGHQPTWGEFSDLSGELKVECVEEGTQIEATMEGLLPECQYSLWHSIADPDGPGYDPLSDERNVEEVVQRQIALGAVGAPDGSENGFRTDDDGKGELEVTTPGGDLSMFGAIEDCALDHWEWQVWGVLHLDGGTNGPTFLRVGPDGEDGTADDDYVVGDAVEQFAFRFREGEPVD